MRCLFSCHTLVNIFVTIILDFFPLKNNIIGVSACFRSIRPHYQGIRNNFESTLTSTKMSARASNTNDDNMITILGFGSLLSEKSSRTTFPGLQNFRLGRVPNFRRVFRHPASIFFQRGIANLETLEMSSLCAEPCDGSSGFVCSIFEVQNNDMMQSNGVPSQAFLEREEEFSIIQVPYTEFISSSSSGPNEQKIGILCTSSSDEEYLQRWGNDRFQEYYGKYGVSTIWGWKEDSGLRPCPVYLRHCYLAAKSMGKECFDSFLDETFLVDRKTTIREYISKYPAILETSPPPELVGRYSG